MVLEDLLYVGIDNGVVVLDLSDPTTPAATAAEPIVISGSPQRIWVDSGFGYTVDLIDGIMSIVNVD